ncbi:MAG: 5-formyltetrahydrofolate cyclo-ligase [Pseudomonadota bacterium]
MTDKTALRKTARGARAAAFDTVDPAPATARLLGELTGHPGPIAFYWPMRTEIDPRPAMTALARTVEVVLPVTHGHQPLTFRRWTLDTVLARDDFGTQYPADGESIDPRTLVVPMLAFDRRGHRLGYGAGHYDRTLEGLRKTGPVTAIGFAYSAQEIAHVPNETTDQPLDFIVTEVETIVPG